MPAGGQPLIVTILLAATALAGCSGSDPGSLAAAPSPGHATNVLDSGSTPDLGESSSSTASTQKQPDPVDVAVDWTGKTGTRVTYCIPQVVIAYCSGVVVHAAQQTHQLDYDGTPQKAHVSAKWTPNTPLTNELVLSVAGSLPCGSGCLKLRELAAKQGPSPIELDLPEIKLAEGEKVAVQVALPPLLPPPQYTGFSADQEFKIEGSLTIIPRTL